MTLKKLLIGLMIISLALTGQAATKKAKKYPHGCFPVGYQFKYYSLVLTRTAKYHPQTIFFVHNKSLRNSIILLQSENNGKPYSMHIKNTIRPNQWGVLATDFKKIKFMCATAARKKVHPHIVECSKYLRVCEFPHTKFGDNHRGNYWVISSSSMNGAKNGARYHGILMIDPKKTRKDKSEGSDV